MSVIVTRGVARIRHAETGQVYEITADELDWDQVGGDERQMGLEITYAAEFVHPTLGVLVWELWEYPLGVENHRDVHVGRHTLLENFSLSLSDRSPDDPDEDADEDADEDGVDPEEFRSKVDTLVEWFHERYEDPAHRTPYESAEGGYQWIWGGPYDARDALSDNFPEDEAAIEAAVKEIESDGIYDWAPTPGHEHDAPYEADYLDPGSDVLDDDAPEEDNPSDLADRLFLALMEVPDHQPGPRFDVDAAGRIEFEGWQDGREPLDFVLRGAIREAAEELVLALQGTNAHRELLAEAQRYSAAVVSNDLTISQLYARGVRLEKINSALTTDIEIGDRPPLPSEAWAALQSVLHLHAATIMADAGGVRLVNAAADYRRPSDETVAARVATQRLSDAVQKAGNLFAPTAQAAVAEAASDLGAGPFPERSTQVSAGILVGFVRAVASLRDQATSGIIGKFVWEALKGTVAVSGTVHVATAGIDQTLSFLLDQAPHLQTIAAVLGPDLQWMHGLANALMAIRRRSLSYRSG